MISGRAGGLGLLVFAGLIPAVTLVLLRGGSHPLSDRAEAPLCSLIGQQAMQRLSAWQVLGYADPPEPEPGSEIACVVTLYAEMPPERLLGEVRVALLTEAMLRRQAGFSQTIDSWHGNWLAEAAASGLAVEPAEGPWEHGDLLRYPDGMSGMVIEDNGVALVLHARAVEERRLLEFARHLAADLRAAP